MMDVAAPVPTPPRPAASVVLLRDSPEGLQVLLLRRHPQSQVLGGVYVFPGGKLDAGDAAAATPHWIDSSPEQLHQRLGEPDTPASLAQSLFVAAMRETYEEAGVWLCEPSAPQGDAPAQAAQLVQRLHTLLGAGQPWPQALQHIGWRWQAQSLQPWSRWITPWPSLQNAPRFDTRFFLARLPYGQQVQHDPHEITAALWLTPRTALKCYWAGELGLIPPQLMALAHLSRHPHVASAWAEAAMRPPPCILPHTFSEAGQRYMCYPGDPLHPIPQRALPGPTRLRLGAERFEPPNGWEGWFT